MGLVMRFGRASATNWALDGSADGSQGGQKSVMARPSAERSSSWAKSCAAATPSMTA
jgi:hypothetical protein